MEDCSWKSKRRHQPQNRRRQRTWSSSNDGRLQFPFLWIFLLLLCWRAGQSLSLMTGRIQVYLRLGTQCSDPDSAAFPPYESSTNEETKPAWFVPATNYSVPSPRGIKFSSRKASTIRNELDYDYIEEKENRELEWLLSTTAKILGPDDDAYVLGSMTKQAIRRTNRLMKSWSRRSSKKGSKSPHVVERLLKRLVDERDKGMNDIVAIDTKTYNILLDAWSNSNEDGSAERCKEILLQMEQMCECGDANVTPNVDSYNAVIKAFVRNGARCDSSSVQNAEAILKRMQRRTATKTATQDEFEVNPNRRSFNLLLYALANSSFEDAPSRAEKILLQMRSECDNGNTEARPDINSYNQLLGAWARGRLPAFEHRMQSIFEEILALGQDMNILPDTNTFNAVMGGWLKSNKSSSLLRVEEVLKLMEESYDAGNEAAKPDLVSFNIITAAYARDARGSSLQSIQKAEQVRTALKRKFKIQPDTISQNTMIVCWGKSGLSEAPERVLKILDSMERDFITRGKVYLKPDAYTYSSVIDCFVRCGKKWQAPTNAQNVLDRMKHLHLNHGGDPVVTSVYNAVLNALAISDVGDAPQRAQALLQDMEKNEGADPCIPKPNRITYNTVIKALQDGTAKHAECAEALLVRLEEEGQINKQILPDSYTYTSVIFAYGRSDANDKAKKALAILKRMLKANQDGNVVCKPTIHAFNAALNACAFVKGDQKRKSETFNIAMTILDLLPSHIKPDHTTYGTALRVCASLLPAADSRRAETVEKIFKEACEQGQVGRLVMTQMKFAAPPQQYSILTGNDKFKRVSIKDLPSAWTCNVRESTGMQNRKSR